jgi:hypothetical protein
MLLRNCNTIVCMERLSISVDPILADAVRVAASKNDTTISAWMAEAAAQVLRNESLRATLAAWELEDGPSTDAALDLAAQELGFSESLVKKNRKANSARGQAAA